jgi:PIN domain nuclease of toxin-antitoxin system
MIMLDTHIAVTLYEGRLGGLSAGTVRRLDREPVAISPAVVLELELLHEIGRLRVGGRPISRYLAEQLSIDVANDRFAEVVDEALALSFTRDPFDRLIVAHAAMLKVPLVTYDENMAQHYPKVLG